MNFKVIRNIIIVICLVVIAYEVAMIGINKMEYKEAADEYQEIEPQEFETFERNGFTVVEWGGTEVK